MVAKTYEAISDAFDNEIMKNNYCNIVKRNAETFWNFKHNYIIDKLDSSSIEINVANDLKNEEELLIKQNEQYQQIPLKVIDKIVNLNYWDISSNESDLISYLQENTVNNASEDILNFACRMKQYFTYVLKCYSELNKGVILDVDATIEYKEHDKIKETEFESREWSIKKWLWTLGNVIVNEAISYDLDTISEISWINKEELKNFMTKDEKSLQDKKLLENLHRFVLRMEKKYEEYVKRYIWIAEWKEYEDSELWIKDFSDVELPKEEKCMLERKVHKTQLEEIEETAEKQETKKKVQKKSEDKEQNNEKKEAKWWINKIKNRFK